MRRFLGSKNSSNATSSSGKGKQRQGGVPNAIPIPQPDRSSTQPSMEVHVSTEVHSAQDHSLHGFHPLGSTSTLEPSPSTASTNSQPLPPEVRVPTHPYPYWQGAHTPSSSQSSLESPMTPSNVSWLSNTAPVNGNNLSNGSSTNLGLNSSISALPSPAGPSSSTHSLTYGRPTPNPSFPPPPATNPPPTLTPRPKLLHPTKSTHSLRVPVQELFSQQLSPIVEQDYLSPEKRPVSLPSSSHDGTGSRTSTAHTARTSATPRTPISPGSDGGATATVTPISPVPLTPVLASARGTPPTPQTQAHTPVTPSSFIGGTVPFVRRKDEEGSDSPRPSPVLTFISRPLNRSISLSSTRTHQSSISSAIPPVIPPLDLRPEFRGQAFLTTPTSLHSRGFLDVGAVGVYDDDAVSDRRESFVTARTGAGRESKYSVGQEDVFVDAEENIRRDSDDTIQPSDTRIVKGDTPPTPHWYPLPHDTFKSHKPPIPPKTAAHAHSASHTSSAPPSYNYPPGPHSSDNHLHFGYHPHRSTPSPNPPLQPGVSAPSLQDLGTSLSASSSFIDRRFAPSTLYLATPQEREFARTTGEKWTIRKERMDTVQVLFWIGFIAPWCWLIGGWLITSNPPSSRGYGYGYTYHNGIGGGSSFLPLWTANATKSVQSFDATKMQHGYPFVAPSVLSLTPPYDTRTVLTPRVVREGKNLWVRRCRIAAVVSGILILIAFIVALVVVGVGHV